MNGRKQINNEINNYITPKRASSKAKDLTGKIQNNPNISNTTKSQVKLNTMSNKQEVPYLPRHNIEHVNKYTDERYRDIKYLNLNNNNDSNNNISKQSNVRKASVDIKVGPATPKYQKTQFMSDRNEINSHNYHTSNQDKQIKNAKTKIIPKNRKDKFSKEQAAIVIQRAFKSFLNRLRMNPKFEMSNLLKKKKLSILKNYNILGNHEQLSLGYLNESESIQVSISKNRSNFNISKSNIKEQEKVTAEFFGNVQKDTNIINIKEEKESKHKDNFIDDYESFVSSKKYISNNNKNNDSHLRQNDSINSKGENPKDDKNLQQLKLSLDKFSDYYKKNKSCQSILRESSDIKPDYCENQINTIHKDQTSIHKEDISETVNIYEKIFKEIKREEKISSDKSNSKIVNYRSEENVRKNLEANSNKNKVNQKFEINTHNTKNEQENSLAESISDYKSSFIERKMGPLKDDTQNNSKMESEYISENKRMVDNITQMLEKEVTKSNIDQLLNENNKEKNYDNNYNNIANNSLNNSSLENNQLYLNKSLQTRETKSIKDETQQKINKIHSLLEKSEINNKYTNILKLTEESNVPQLSHINSQYTADILNMALELKESKKTTETMKTIIEELRREIRAKEEFHKKELQEKLAIQKHEYDNIMQRQTGLIEGLLSEKKKLSQNSDEVGEKLESIERNNHKKFQQMVENFDLELKKNKDAWFQAEKIRRKKWEDQKMKEIKEITVKGLEPEIERILSSHKQEISKMEDKLNEELRRQKEKLLNENERRISDIKERFHKEKEDTIEHERSLGNHRMRNQNERLEEEFNEDRRRWNSNLQAEIQQLVTLREKDKKLYDDQLSKIEDRNSKTIEEKENYYKNKIIEMEKRFEEKLKSEEENFKSKYIKEKEKFLEDKQKEYENKSKETKNDLIKDRDKQIQIIIEKLGEETINERKKIQIECERKANEINKNLKIESEQMRQKLSEFSDKLAAESKVRLMLDDNLEVLSRKLHEKEREVSKKEKQLMELNSIHNEIDSKYSSLVKDFNREKLDIELEYKGKVQKAEGEFKLLTDKIESVKNYYEGKINEIQSIHKNEIVEIEEKIKKTFYRKDEVIKKFQEEAQMKDITIQKYEELLAKQRKELLSGH